MAAASAADSAPLPVAVGAGIVSVIVRNSTGSWQVRVPRNALAKTISWEYCNFQEVIMVVKTEYGAMYKLSPDDTMEDVDDGSTIHIVYENKNWIKVREQPRTMQENQMWKVVLVRHVMVEEEHVFEFHIPQKPMTLAFKSKHMLPGPVQPNVREDTSVLMTDLVVDGMNVKQVPTTMDDYSRSEKWVQVPGEVFSKNDYRNTSAPTSEMVKLRFNGLGIMWHFWQDYNNIQIMPMVLATDEAAGPIWHEKEQPHQPVAEQPEPTEEYSQPTFAGCGPARPN